ncbi:MAG: hypothetical protein E6Q89_07385 [Bacteroidia bacterium]|nr:MAG: hypothetical protein E6Q89_07385 [Bacteroidia bacterium]
MPSATQQNEMVVNGMSPSKRDSPFSNSGMVVAVDESDWKNFHRFGPLAAMEYQKSVEQKAWQEIVILHQSTILRFYKPYSSIVKKM